MDPQKNAEVIARIKYLMKEMGVRQVQFAERIGVDTSNLSKYLNAHMPLSESLLNRIVVNLGVSKEWLLDGTDLPFGKTPVRLDAGEGGNLSALAPAGTPVYDVDATAGTESGRNGLFANENIVGWVNLPNMSPNCRIVRVSGDSMAPVINDGDFVAVRELSNPTQIYWGQIATPTPIWWCYAARTPTMTTWTCAAATSTRCCSCSMCSISIRDCSD